MTKDEVAYIFKKYRHINNAIKSGKEFLIFVSDGRKYEVEINENVKKVCQLIKIVQESMTDKYDRQMIRDILFGYSDIRNIAMLPFEKNLYYSRKQAFVEKVFNCCIAWGMVSFDEILK